MSKRPSKQAVNEMKFPTAPLAKFGIAIQTGEPFHLTEQERVDAQKAIAEIEQATLAGNLPKDPIKKRIVESVHKMLTMSLEYDGKKFSIEFEDDKYRNKL